MPYYLLALFAIIVAFVVVPSVQDILTLKYDIQEERAKLEESYAKGLSLRKTKLQLISIQEDVEQLEQSMLRPGQELFLITTLEDIATSKNLEQEIVMDDLPDDVSQLIKLPLQVELKGRFSDILFYVIEVERLDFYINWKKVTMRTRRTTRGGRSVPNQAPEGGTDAQNEDITVILEGETYWKP